jgi:hypothetical protein
MSTKASTMTQRQRSDDFHIKMVAGTMAFVAVFIAAYLYTSNPPFDAAGYLFGRDFVSTWMSARGALEGHPGLWYDFDTYNLALQHLFGPDYPEHHLTYPPHLLLLIWPFGLMPYLPAFAVYCIVGFALYMAAAASGERRIERLMMLAVSPAIAVNIFSGQNGFFSAALLIWGLSLLDRRPILSGVLFGLLTVKPHLGVLLPLMLALTGRWRCIAAAAVTTIGLLAAATAIFGADIWGDYVEHSLPMQRVILEHSGGILPPMMVTAFTNARLAGLPLAWCWGIQSVVSIAAIAAVIWTYARRRDPVLSTALLLTATFAVTPYAFNYDMIVFGWVLASVRDHEANTPLDDRIAIVVWTLPLTTMILGLAHVPVSFLALAAFATRLIWRMACAESVAAPNSGLAQNPA